MAAKKSSTKKPKEKTSKGAHKYAKRGRSTAIWKGTVSFGLLNIPVTLQTAEEEKELHFTQLDSKNLAPVKMKRVNSSTGKEIDYKDIVKGFKLESGKYVVMSDADFKAAAPKATQTVDIEDFVPLKDIDPTLFEKPYYVVPQDNGVKGYFLLRDALAKSEKVAVTKVVLRTKQHLALLMARGEYLVLELLRFAHEVLEEKEVHYLDDIERPKYADRELKMAEQLIDSMTADWDPDRYEDTYYDEMMAKIQEKAKTGKITEVEQPEEDVDGNTGAVVDLLPLLRKSLEEGGKNGKAGRGGKGKSA